MVMFGFITLCQLLEAQMEYHRSAVHSLEEVLPKVRHHFGAARYWLNLFVENGRYVNPLTPTVAIWVQL